MRPELKPLPPTPVSVTVQAITIELKMASNLQAAMEALIAVFHSYSGKEGDKFKLSRAELKSLLQVELAELMAASKDPMVVDKIMTELDENQDGQVDFQEFVLLVVALTVACNEFFIDENKCKCKEDEKDSHPQKD